MIPIESDEEAANGDSTEDDTVAEMDDETLEDNVNDDDQLLFWGDASHCDRATFKFTINPLCIVTCFKE